MKNRILGIVLALSLLAAIFAALPAKGAVYYTGSVLTTDSTNAPKTQFFRGDNVYVNVELKFDGTPFDGNIRVELQRTTDGVAVSSFTDRTNDPVVGWFNSSASTPFPQSLWTGAAFTGELTVYDVVVYYTGGGPWDEIARTPIIVKAVGITLDPPMAPYYPGEAVTITVVTTHTTDVFYVQIVNDTGATMVNWTGQVALTGFWNTVWTIDAAFPDGTFRLYVRDAGTHASWFGVVSFDVQKYVMNVDSDRNDYLPGETAKITYAVFDTATMTPYSGVAITYSAHWLNTSGNDTWLNNTLPGSDGIQEFLIPADIALYSNVDITYWANESGTARSAEETVWLYIGELMADVTVNVGPYMPGATVTVYVDAWVSGEDLPGATVDIAVERNATAITAYGAGGLTTNLDGRVTHSFKLDSGAVQGSYVVNATISKVGYSLNRMASFRVAWDGELMISFDKEYYYTGDDVQLNFRTIWNNQEVTGNSIAFIVYASFGIMTTGNTNGTSATFNTGPDYYGWLQVTASVNLDGYILTDWETTDVRFADIILTTENDDYKQGDTLVFNFQLLTTLTEGSLEWSITDSDGVKVASGEPDFATSGSFSYAVPDLNPSDSYTGTITMRTTTGAMRTATVTVDIIPDYDIQIWIGKSSYTSGEYKPGQKLAIHYSINVYTFGHLPVYKIRVANSWDDTVMTVLVTDPTGTIEYQVPDDAPSAWFWVDASLYDPVSGGYLSGDETMFMVNNQLSGWDKSVGGMSAIDFTLLVLIVIMILLLIIVPFLKGRMGGEKPAKKVETPTPPPPAPPSP